MSKELIEKLRDNRVTGFNLEVAASHAADRIEELEKQLANSQKREVMLRQELLHYGEHEGSCSIVDLDADGFHCECDCGLSAILSATADLDGFVLCEKKPVARRIAYGSLVFLDGYSSLADGTPLYRAKEQGK